MIPRRTAIGGALASLLQAETLPPVRGITKGPKFHWFGYYDKIEFDPGSRFVLGMEAGFEHRSPAPDDEIRLGFIDLDDRDRWTDIGSTRAWCWQQGCMLQWLPRSRTEVICNDREDRQFVSRILDVRSGKSRTLPGPIYALSPDARWAVSTDFSRLGVTRPGYGYHGVADPHINEPAPEQSGIWRMDLSTGQREQILSLAAIARIPYRDGEPQKRAPLDECSTCAPARRRPSPER